MVVTNRERVEEAHRLWSDASHKKLRSARWLSTELDAAREAARIEFATARGCKFSIYPFGLDELLRGRVGNYVTRQRDRQQRGSMWPVLDHCEYLKQGRRPVALLTHSYAKREAIEEFVTHNALVVEYLPSSWYYPGGATAALLTPKAAT